MNSKTILAAVLLSISAVACSAAPEAEVSSDESEARKNKEFAVLTDCQVIDGAGGVVSLFASTDSAEKKVTGLRYVWKTKRNAPANETETVSAGAPKSSYTGSENGETPGDHTDYGTGYGFEFGNSRTNLRSLKLTTFKSGDISLRVGIGVQRDDTYKFTCKPTNLRILTLGAQFSG